MIILEVPQPAKIIFQGDAGIQDGIFKIFQVIACVLFDLNFL
jgi:hypothetical protein